MVCLGVHYCVQLLPAVILIFSRERLRRVLHTCRSRSSHLHTCRSTSSHPHTCRSRSSHLHICRSRSSHPHTCRSRSSHPHICRSTSSHLQICRSPLALLLFSLKAGRCRRSATKRNPFARNGRWTSKT